MKTMALYEFLSTQTFSPGTIFTYLDRASCYVDTSGYIIQTKRGLLSDDMCYRVFTTICDWLETFKKAEEINVFTQGSYVFPPHFPIYVPEGASPNSIVQLVLQKNKVEYKYKSHPSLNMRHSAAKINRLELDANRDWQKLKLQNPETWQKTFDKRTQDIVKIYMEIHDSSDADKQFYQVHNSKYPRVFVKCGTSMRPVYSITDGSDFIYVDGLTGKTWESVGCDPNPEIWVSWNGTIAQQKIIHFKYSDFTKPLDCEIESQLYLKLKYNLHETSEGCLPSGKQVMNLVTKQYLQSWECI